MAMREEGTFFPPEQSVPRSQEGDRERLLFEGRLDDLCSRADGGEIPFTDFLTPKEQHLTRQYLRKCGREESLRFFGGFDGAERCVACFLPDYMSELLQSGVSERDALSETVDGVISMLEIRGSGYRAITHRDILGSALALGVERDAIGDIILLPAEENGREQPRAYLFCTEKIAPFLLSELKRIGNDAVRVHRGTLPEDFRFERKVREISDTVASNRLDCVVGALTNTSREKAQSLIRGGMVEVDYEQEQRSDRRLTPPSVMSVRGYGKYSVLSLSDVTKKGRLRLRAEQYL